MVEIEDICDCESFIEWVEKRSQTEVDIIVGRAALRVLPIFLFWEFVESEESAKLNESIRVLWQSLFSYNFNHCSNTKKPVPLPDLGRSRSAGKQMLLSRSRLWSVSPFADAAHAATFAAFSQNALPSYIEFPNLALQHAIETDIWIYVQSDCEDLDRNISFKRKKLWGESQNPTSEIWTDTKAQLLKEESDWNFWVRWYDSVLAGKPLSCEMLYKILSISQKDWRKDAAHVNGLIAEIEEEFLLKSTPLAEKVEFNQETQRLRIVPERMSQKALYSNLLEIIRDGMADLRDSPQFDNALSALKPVFENVLDRTFEKYLSSPQRVHDDFVKAKRRIQRLIDVGELAPNDEVIEFVEDLDRGAAHIRANMPQVRASMAALAELRIAEASEDDIRGIHDGTEELAEHSEPEMAEVLREDANQILVASREVPIGAPRVPVPDAAYRLTHRIIESKRILTKENVLKAKNGAADGFTAGQLILAAVEILKRLIVV